MNDGRIYRWLRGEDGNIHLRTLGDRVKTVCGKISRELPTPYYINCQPVYLPHITLWPHEPVCPSCIDWLVSQGVFEAVCRQVLQEEG